MTVNLYFSRGIIRGLGLIDLLMVPQLAPEGSSSRKLIGSYVDELDHGPLFFKTRCSPSLQHAWQAQFFLTQAQTLGELNGIDLLQEHELAGFSQEYKIETKAGVSAKGSFPGAPISASLSVDYGRLRTAKITLGAGSRKIYIPSQVIQTAYEAFASRSDQFHRVIFDPKVMLVNQIVLARNLSVEVESKATFGGDFEAKATEVSDTQAGVTFSRTDERKYSVNVSDGQDYLFGIGALEANELVRIRR